MKQATMSAQYSIHRFTCGVMLSVRYLCCHYKRFWVDTTFLYRKMNCEHHLILNMLSFSISATAHIFCLHRESWRWFRYFKFCTMSCWSATNKNAASSLCWSFGSLWKMLNKANCGMQCPVCCVSHTFTLDIHSSTRRITIGCLEYRSWTRLSI